MSSNALPVKDGAPRRSLNLEDYKKRRGLIWCGRTSSRTHIACVSKSLCVCVWVKVRDWVFVCMSKSENVLKDVCLNDDKIDCSSNTKEILIKRRQHFSQRIFLGKKKKENLVQLCLFFGFLFFFVLFAFTDKLVYGVCLCVCLFFLMYLTSLLLFWIFWSQLPFFIFFFFFLQEDKDNMALVDYYLEQGTYLRKFRLFRHFKVYGHLQIWPACSHQ